MFNRIRSHLKPIALISLAFVIGIGVYWAGKTPKILRSSLERVLKDLERKQGIHIELGNISVEGFLTVRVEQFLLEKKDVGLWVQAKFIRARLSPLSYWFDGNPVSRLEIDTPEIMARLDFNWNGPKTNLKMPDLTLNELIIRQGRAEIQLNDKVLQVVDSYVNSSVSPRRVQIHSLMIQTPEIKFITAGILRLDDAQNLGIGSDLHVKLTGKLSEIPEIRRLDMPLEADMVLDGRVKYPNNRQGIELNGHVQAQQIQIDTVQIRSLSSSIFINSHAIELRQAKAYFAGTTSLVSGRLNWDKKLSFAADIDTNGASLYQLLSDVDVKNSWVDLKLDTHLVVKGQVWPQFFVEGKANGLVSSLRVHDTKDLILETALPIQFSTGILIDKHAFQFRKASFFDGKSKATVDCHLFLDDREGMWLEGQFEKLDFSSVKNKISTESYRGIGEAQVSISGAYNQLHIEAPIQILDFEFNQIAFGNIVGIFEILKEMIYVKKIEAQKKSLEYEGNLALSLGTPLKIDLDAILKKGKAEDLLGSLGTGSIYGNLHMKGPIEKNTINQLSGHLELSGDIQLQADLDAGRGDLRIKQTPIGNIDFELQLKPNHISAQGFFTESKAHVEVEIDLSQKKPFKANLFMPYGPLKSLIPGMDWIQTLNVHTGAYVRAHGNLEEIEQSQIDFDLSPTVFYFGTLKFLASHPLRAYHQKKSWKISTALFRSVHGDEIQVQGFLEKNNLELDLNTHGDLWILTHLDERIEGAYGDFKAQVRIHGPLEHLNYIGKAEIAPNSYLSLRDYPPGLTKLSGFVDFVGEKAELKLNGEAAQGRFFLDGFINFQNKNLDNIQIDLKKMPIYYSSFLTGVANGFLRLDGQFKEPTLSGNIQVSNLLISKELTPEELKSPRSRAQKQSVRLNISLSAQDNIRVESKSFNAELRGNVKLVGTNNAPGLIGELGVLSGEVYFRNHYYHILKARASFDNPFRIEPYIDVEASSQILEYDILVRSEGLLTRPKLYFSSKPSLSQPELLSLILFGFTNQDTRDNLGVARAAGLEVLSAYSGIGDKLLNALPDSHIDELRLGSLYNQNGGVTSSVVIGMQVFKGMRLRFQSALIQNISGNREKRLELEKYINRRWRWRLIWNSEGVTNYGDAGGDLWVRWDF